MNLMNLKQTMNIDANNLTKKKILIITQNFPPEEVGGATHNFEMAKYLAALGCDVSVITTLPAYPYGEFNKVNEIKEDNLYPFEVQRIWAYRPTETEPSTFKRILQYLSFSLNAFFHSICHRRYMVVITSQPPEFTMMTGFLLKTLLRKKWVVDVRDLWLENAVALGFFSEKSIYFQLFDKIRRFCLKKLDVFAYTSPFIKEWFYSHYKISTTTVFNPNGIDPAEYPYSSSSGTNIIYIGNIGHAYDLKNVITALTFIPDKTIKLIIRGGGDKKEDLVTYVNSLQLNDRVIFHEKISRHDLLLLISSCRLGICPLKEEDSLRSVIPIKVVEYMGCGIPFIGTGFGEIERLAKESGAGVVIKNDPNTIAQSIESLYYDEEKCKIMGHRARNYAENEFNKIKIIERLLNTICPIPK